MTLNTLTQAKKADRILRINNKMKILMQDFRQNSAQARRIKNKYGYKTVNEALIKQIYKSSENQDFKTYNQWAKEGFIVDKEASPFLIWGQPDRFGNFNLVHLYSNSQVSTTLKLMFL